MPILPVLLHWPPDALWPIACYADFGLPSWQALAWEPRWLAAGGLCWVTIGQWVTRRRSLVWLGPVEWRTDSLPTMPRSSESALGSSWYGASITTRHRLCQLFPPPCSMVLSAGSMQWMNREHNSNRSWLCSYNQCTPLGIWGFLYTISDAKLCFANPVFVCTCAFMCLCVFSCAYQWLCGKCSKCVSPHLIQ